VLYRTDADLAMAMRAVVAFGDQLVPAVCDGRLEPTDVG